MRDDVEWTANSKEEMAAIQQKMATAQRYLDRVTPHPDPILQLPLAVYRFVRHRPDLPRRGERVCGAAARLEEDSPGGPYRPAIVLRSRVTCELSSEHRDEHIASIRRELPGLWRVLRWWR